MGTSGIKFRNYSTLVAMLGVGGLIKEIKAKYPQQKVAGGIR